MDRAVNLTIVAGEIGSVMVQGMRIPIYTNNLSPTSNFTNSAPWHVPVAAKLVKLSSLVDIYDSVKNEVNAAFEVVDMADYTSHEIQSIEKVIHSYYGQTPAVPAGVNAVTLSQVDLEGWEIFFNRGSGTKDEIAVQSRDVGLGAYSSSQPIVFNVHITNLAHQNELQSKQFDKYVATMRAYYKVRVDATLSVAIGTVQKAVQTALESSTPGGDAFVGAVQTRNIKQDVQTKLESLLSINILSEPGVQPSDVKDLVDLARNSAGAFFKALPPMGPADLLNLSNNVIIYTANNIREELKPDEFRNLVTDLDTSSGTDQSWTDTYNFLSQKASSTNDEKKFHDEISSQYKSDKSMSGKIAGAYAGISAGAKFNMHEVLEKSSNQLDSSEVSLQQSFQSYLQQSTTNAGTLRSYFHEKWTGQKYQAGTIPKKIDLYRISTTTLQSIVSTSVTKTIKGQPLIVPLIWQFPLNAATQSTVETISSVEKAVRDVKKEVGDLKTHYDKEVGDLKTHYDNELNNLSSDFKTFKSLNLKYSDKYIFVRADSNLQPNSSYHTHTIDAPHPNVTVGYLPWTFGDEVVGVWWDTYFGSHDNWSTYMRLVPHGNQVLYELFPGNTSFGYHIHVNIIYRDK